MFNIINIPYSNIKYIKPSTVITIAISIVAAIVFFLCLVRLNYDFLLSPIINNHIMSIMDIRESIITILFRFSPFIVTVVIAISSLTVNSFTGSFFKNIISDWTLVILIAYTLFFITFHSCIEFYIPNEIVEGYTYSDNVYAIIFTDIFLSFVNIVLAIFASVHIFYYSWPKTLLDKFSKNIKIYMEKMSLGYSGNSLEEYTNHKREMNIFISWFNNLFSNSIKSKDYDFIESAIMSLIDIWKFMIVVNKKEQRELDRQFHKNIDRIDMNEQLSDDFSEVYEKSLEQIVSVLTNAFKQGYKDKEYFICRKIILKLGDLSIMLTENKEDFELDKNDLNKVLDIYSTLFNISLKNENDEDSELSLLIISQTKNIYESRFKEIYDFNIYYKYIYRCIYMDKHKFLKNVLDSFREVFDESKFNSKSLYDNTLNQIHELLLFALKRKRMKCFANLIRFCVISRLDLNRINDLFIDKLKVAQNFLGLEDFLREVGNDSYLNNDNPERYLNHKIYVIWYSYYLLQLEISKDRIDPRYHDLTTERQNISFHLISTLLLDLETFEKYWDSLFVNQSEYFFLKTCGLIINSRNIDQNVADKLDSLKQSAYLKKLKMYV